MASHRQVAASSGIYKLSNFDLVVITAITTVVAGQVLAAAIIDHFGLLEAHLRPMDLTRAIGLAVVLFGVWLTVK